MIGKRQSLRVCALTTGLLGLFVVGAAFAATIAVNSLADPGAPGICTLRDAITAANTMTATNGCAAGSGNDTINFSPRMTGTISLVSTLPEVTDSLVTINGPASRNITIVGNLPIGGGMKVAAGATLNLNNLSVAHGFLDPLIEVAAGATLNLNNVSIADGFAGLGAGINNAGTLTVTNSSFSNNGGDVGAGIFNDVGATATLTNSTLSGNGGVHGPGAIYNDGTLSVTNSTFFGNGSGHAVGGIDNFAVLTVTNSTFSGNTGGASTIQAARGSRAPSWRTTWPHLPPSAPTA